MLKRIIASFIAAFAAYLVRVASSITAVEASATYCVIDLSAGASAAFYPVTYLDAPPPGGFNTDEYKTTKLVLKRIEAGSFIMGRDQNNESHRVTLTKPFYCGLFEVTQKQWLLVIGSNPSDYKGDKRPVECVNQHDIRGSSSGAQWPTSNAVDASSFLGKLRARTHLDFDLPTEAQWEYACRAGTTTDYNNGTSYGEDYSDDPNLNLLGRYSGNRADGKGGYTDAHTEVGSYRPNAWGLYDMHGNVCEWCLDRFWLLAYGADPKGDPSGSQRVMRGGGWFMDAEFCTAPSRGSSNPFGSRNSLAGFRLVRVLSD